MKTNSAKRKRVKLQIKANPKSNVYVSGTFNEWSEDAKKLKDSDGKGNYTAILMLFPGEYQYKFIINGEWKIDSGCQNWIKNDFGTLNSLMKVS